ncbi:MAG: MaoC/PaaZ C-terminal domain-containing protein [Terriglobales bacterium]
MTGTDQLFLEDFCIGQTFAGESKVISEADVLTFSALTGDKHPVHYDPAYAATTRFGRPVVHGLHLISLTAVGATKLSGKLKASMIAFVEQEATFVKPVFVGDRVRSSFEVTEVKPAEGRDWGRLKLLARLSNDTSDIVLECFHTYRLRRRPAVTPEAIA